MYEYIKYINIPVNKILLDNYALLGLNESSLIVLIRLIEYSEEGNKEVTFSDLLKGSTLERDTLANTIQFLIQNNFIDINTKFIEEKYVELYDFTPLYNKLLDFINDEVPSRDDKRESIKELFQYIEQLYGRTLGPSEYERMSAWIEEDDYSVELIKEGVDIAYKNEITSLSYVEKILNSMSKEVDETPYMPLKNWLEGEE